MDTASLQFLAFGLAAALISNFSRSRVWRSIVLFVASIVFLGLLAPRLVALLPLAGFLLLGYVSLHLLYRRWLRSAAWSIVAVILAYVWLKKICVSAGRLFLHSFYFTLGLSYIFFRVLHC